MAQITFETNPINLVIILTEATRRGISIDELIHISLDKEIFLSTGGKEKLTDLQFPPSLAADTKDILNELKKEAFGGI